MFIDPYAKIVMKGSYSTENHAEMTDQMTWEDSTTVYKSTVNAQGSHLLQFSEMPTSEKILPSATSGHSEALDIDYMTALPGTSSEVSSGKFHITQAIIDRITYMHRDTDPATENELIKTSEMTSNEGTTKSQEGKNI